MPAPAATKAAIQRAIEATRAAGLTAYAVSVSRDGTIRIETATPKEKPVETTNALTPKKWSLG